MKKIDDEIQQLLREHNGNIREILAENTRLDYWYALSDQRELLLEWYDFDPEAELLQVGADYGAMTGLFAARTARVTVLDREGPALGTVKLRYPELSNVSLVQEPLGEYARRMEAEEKKYDYVVLAGTLEKPFEENIRAARSLLKAGGVLILAVSNIFGVKYWAGAARDENSISKKRLTELLRESDGGQTFCEPQFYYPMPDHRTPLTIYSDRYLPRKGDLSRELPVYDYPCYRVTNMGEGFDAVCEDDVFDQYANSYLVFWGAETQQTVYIKYNKTRREEFQLKTSILDGPEGQFVEKAALTEAGAAHIASFSKKRKWLEAEYRRIGVVPAEVTGKAARFPYVTGESWSELLGAQIEEGRLPQETLTAAMDQIFDLEPEGCRPFEKTEEFMNVFGSGSEENTLEEADLELLRLDSSCAVTNIDALFENILMSKEGNRFLDYEWVFAFPVPLRFIKYRILYYFYEQYKGLLKDQTLGSVLAGFGITPELEAVYQKMERNFQDYVHGENQQYYLGNYMVYSRDPARLRQTESDLARARERIEQMKIHAREKDVTIRKITEVQRLTNNHVNNLEIIIGNLRHEIDEMAKTLAYLDRHESLVFRCRRKLGDAFNRRYPKGSPQRKRLRYKKEYLLHPIRSHRLYSTEEGRNLRNGDFDIGDIYREHGRLRFAAVEHPKVSIVIPVYNQIHYTYACLLSILEHTKDVSYEVVIADDVSTDATSHLSDYAEGLVICRGETNQGFLRNCNQAAARARGEYLMFLNNDTQVTEGWLSSLVKLIESDPSIGMVGSKLVYPDGRLQEAGGIIWSDGSGWNYGRLDDPDKSEYNYVKDVDYISGAAILLSRRLWDQIGGFDDRFAPAYCEDSDLAFEVRKAGYRVVYQPLSKVIHFEGISNGTDVEGSGLKRYQVVNSEKLKEKWARELTLQCENTGNPDPFRARERSMGKRIILVVDHYVPTYDRDAGSKTTFQYLKMFLQKGFVVKFLGDNFLHEEPYSTTLQQMGIEILYGAEYQSKIWDWIRDHGDDIAVAYLNRPHIASKYIDYILDNTDTKVIYYGHDLHFLREGREYQLTGDPKKREDAEYWKSIELSLMSKAAVSYYPSYVERDAIREIDPTIQVKDITAYVFEKFLTGLQEDFARREGLLFVGGFAHPPNADAVLWFAREIYPGIRERMEAAGQTPPDFYVVGSRVTEEIKALEQPGNGIIVKGFVSEEELSRLYGECRIVVVPLRYGAGVKGKVVEAIYNGAPIVTTSIGAEGIPQVEDVLLVADEAEAFAAAVAGLYQDPEACRELSRRTQAYIRKHFSVDAAWKRIEEDFLD